MKKDKVPAMDPMYPMIPGEPGPYDKIPTRPDGLYPTGPNGGGGPVNPPAPNIIPGAPEYVTGVPDYVTPTPSDGLYPDWIGPEAPDY